MILKARWKEEIIIGAIVYLSDSGMIGIKYISCMQSFMCSAGDPANVRLWVQ